MKVLSSPLEGARESTPMEASDRARLRVLRAETSTVATPAVSPAQTELDSATRQSLSRLASLIRGQIHAVESEDDLEKEKRRRHEKSKLELEKRKTANPDDIEAGIASATRSSSALERLEECLAKETRKRGAAVYKKQKSEDTIRMILSELKSA